MRYPSAYREEPKKNGRNRKRLRNHWSWAADKGLMNGKTAEALKSACRQVLSSVGKDWEGTDVRQLDPDEMFRRFQNLRGKDFKHDSLRAYKERFKWALESYLRYIENPAGWKAPREQRPQSAAQVAGRKRANGAAKKNDDLEGEPLPASTLKFEVPIPGKGSVPLIFPEGMTEEDLDMVDAMLRAYVKRASAQSKASQSQR